MFTGKISQNANYDKGNFLSGQISIENLKKNPKNNVIFSEIFELFDVASGLTVFFLYIPISILYRVCIISLKSMTKIEDLT